MDFMKEIYVKGLEGKDLNNFLPVHIMWGDGGVGDPPVLEPTTPPKATEEEETTLDEETVARIQDLASKQEAGETLSPEDQEFLGKYEITKDSEEEIKAAAEIETKVKALLDKDPATLTEEEKKYITDNTEEETLNFLETLKEKGGVELDLDYGGVAPESPEGIVLREKAIIDAAQTSYEASLQKSYPDAYRLINHLNAGGTLDNFLEVKLDQDLVSTKLKKEDSTVLESFMSAVLTKKGTLAEDVKDIVQLYKDKGTLYDRAVAAQAELKTITALEQQEANKKQAAFDQKVSKLSDDIDTKIQSGKIGSFQIKAGDREGFNKFVSESVRIGQDANVIVKPMAFTPETLEKDLQLLYLLYKEGNLEDIVANKAKTAYANRIIKKKGSGFNIKYKGQTNTPSKTFVPISEIL